MPATTTPHGVSLNYDTFGDPRHPAMVLIQGLGAHMLGWHNEFCRLLADRGHHIIRFDNRDVGLSQKFPAGGYTLADMADDTTGLLDALHIDTAHVVGQSMGGMIAQHVAISIIPPECAHWRWSTARRRPTSSTGSTCSPNGSTPHPPAAASKPSNSTWRTNQPPLHRATPETSPGCGNSAD